MRVAIDATALLLRSAGVKSYIYYWLASMREQAGSDSITTFPFFSRIRPLDHEHSLAGPVSTWAGLAFLHGLNASRMPWTAPGVDIFHTAHHLQNPPRRTLLTTTLHDMTCWLTPELHSRANVQLTRWFGENLLPRVNGIIAVSDSTRRDALEILDLDPERITVIHPGVADAYFDVTADDVLAVRARQRLERPYVLFLGTIEPRKNIQALLDAWSGLPQEIRDAFELLIAGPIGWADPATVAQLKEPGHGRRYLGYVPETELPGLTAGAAVLAYPSLYEGFGLPVAQAMAAGVPVLTSDLSSLPEVAGEAAVLVDPQSTNEIASGLRRLLISASLRERLGGAGRRKAREYRWEITARRSLEWFHHVAGASAS